MELVLGSIIFFLDDAPVEVVLPSTQRLVSDGDMLHLGELLNLVEAGMRWWQTSLGSSDADLRKRAEGSIQELAKIQVKLSQHLADDRTTVRIATRLPVPPTDTISCPECRGGNRADAMFCQHCGGPLPRPDRPQAVQNI